jgi:K+-sensing histidine kinase KdpD
MRGMAVKAQKQKNPAAVALGRKGGKKGGPARAATLTPKQRSESARKAVQARWAKAKERRATSTTDTSDNALLALLKRLKAANDTQEVRQLSDQLERAIFHKQYPDA